MEQVVSATEARIHFGEMMRRVVEKQEAVIVERSGEPQVVVISLAQYEQYKALRGAQSDWLQEALAVRQRIAQELDGRPVTPPEEIIREMREERSEHFSHLR